MIMKKIIQQYIKAQLNNGGPATGAKMLIDSYLKEKYEFVEMSDFYSCRYGGYKLFRYFYKTIKENNPSIVHIRGVQSEGFIGVLVAKLLGVKCVLSVHGLASDSKSISKAKKILYKYLLEPFALKNADLVYCVCKYAAEREYIKKNVRNLYGYIHNAAPSYSLDNYDYLRSLKRKELGIDSDDILISYVGRISSDKGLIFLLDAFRSIHANNGKIYLCLAGQGALIDDIKKNYADLLLNKSLILLGKILDVKNLLMASDIFAFPTLHENLSNSLLEACTVGLPVVATNVGGNPEVIKHNVNGLLVNPASSKELENSLLLLINNKSLRDSLGKESRQIIKNNFSPEYIFAQIDKMYETLL